MTEPEEMQIIPLQYRGFWLLSLVRGKQVLGYWSSGLRSWIAVPIGTDVAIWAFENTAIEYLARNRRNMLAAWPVLNELLD